MSLGFIIAGSIILIGLIFAFNRIVRYRNNVHDAWSNIDVFLKKRYELVPVLVNTVKGYAHHEEKTFLEVAEARSAALGVPDFETSKKAISESKLSGSINKLLVLQEAYPELKANNSFLKLQQQLAEIEQDLERSRRYYNATVRENNTFGESFPINFLGKMMSYKAFEFFTLSTNEKEIHPIQL